MYTGFVSKMEMLGFHVVLQTPLKKSSYLYPARILAVNFDAMHIIQLE